MQLQLLLQPRQVFRRCLAQRLLHLRMRGGGGGVLGATRLKGGVRVVGVRVKFRRLSARTATGTSRYKTRSSKSHVPWRRGTHSVPGRAVHFSRPGWVRWVALSCDLASPRTRGSLSPCMWPCRGGLGFSVAVACEERGGRSGGHQCRRELCIDAREMSRHPKARTSGTALFASRSRALASEHRLRETDHQAD